MRNSIAQEALPQHGEEKLGVFKTPKVFHVMNTLPRGRQGSGAIETSEANAV